MITMSLAFLTYAQVAQLVEQRTENPRVAGSIPALGTPPPRRPYLYRHVQATKGKGL